MAAESVDEAVTLVFCEVKCRTWLGVGHPLVSPEPSEPKVGQRRTTNLGKAIVYSVKFPVQGTGQTRAIRTD